MAYDVIITSLIKTMKKFGNLDLRETMQMIYLLKGNNESFPIM